MYRLYLSIDYIIYRYKYKSFIICFLFIYIYIYTLIVSLYYIYVVGHTAKPRVLFGSTRQHHYSSYIYIQKDLQLFKTIIN